MEARPSQCPLCSKTFVRKAHMLRHYQSRKSKASRLGQMPICIHDG